MGGDTIGRIIILELTERDSSAFEDILTFISRHPDLRKWELRDEPVLSFPGLEINLARRKITSNGQEISFTAKEYDIFCLLAANKNRVLTYEQIYEKVWGDFLREVNVKQSDFISVISAENFLTLIKSLLIK